MPSDSATGHGTVVPVVRREQGDYARDLLIAAAGRDSADLTPHQVWGKARADWELTRVAAGRGFDQSPFSGTRMGEVMAAREVLRAARFKDEYAPVTPMPVRTKRTPQPQVPESTPQVATGLVDRVSTPSNHGIMPREEREARLAAAQRVVDEVTQQQREIEQQYRELTSQIQQVRREEQGVARQIDQVGRTITQGQRERDNRGLFAKMFKPNAGVDELAQLVAQEVSLKQQRVDVVQRREGLEHDLTVVAQRREDVREELGAARTAVSFAFVEGIQTTTFDVNASPRSESSSADVSADVQVGMNQSRGHDHGLGL